MLRRSSVSSLIRRGLTIIGGAFSKRSSSLPQKRHCDFQFLPVPNWSNTLRICLYHYRSRSAFEVQPNLMRCSRSATI